MFILKDIYIYIHFSTNNMLFSYSLNILLKLYANEKKVFGCLILPRIVGTLILIIFTLWIELAKTPNICVLYPNSMIYLPLQIYALCPVLSGVIVSFRTKCLIMPNATLTTSMTYILLYFRTSYFHFYIIPYLFNIYFNLFTVTLWKDF